MLVSILLVLLALAVVYALSFRGHTIVEHNSWVEPDGDGNEITQSVTTEDFGDGTFRKTTVTRFPDGTVQTDVEEGVVVTEEYD